MATPVLPTVFCGRRGTVASPQCSSSTEQRSIRPAANQQPAERGSRMQVSMQRRHLAHRLRAGGRGGGGGGGMRRVGAPWIGRRHVHSSAARLVGISTIDGGQEKTYADGPIVRYICHTHHPAATVCMTPSALTDQCCAPSADRRGRLRSSARGRWPRRSSAGCRRRTGRRPLRATLTPRACASLKSASGSAC
jgi:hypothetical protein